MPNNLTVAEFLAVKRRPRATYTLVADPELAATLHDARTRLVNLEKYGADVAGIDVARAAVAAARDAAEPLSMTFVFEALDPDEYKTLLDEHPPTKDQQAEFTRLHEERLPGVPAGKAPWNSDTFPAALMAKACIEPGLSIEEATALLTDRNVVAVEREQLFTTALSPNGGANSPDLS